MLAKFNLAVVSATRAEYGLLRSVLFKLFKISDINVQLFVTGTHLEAEYGNTVQEIEKDKFNIFDRVSILKYGTKTPYSTTKTTAHTTKCFAKRFKKAKPDAVMVLGDRYEIFGVCVAAAGLLIPIIHISGGDVTHGAQDDYFRHCITKMASLHFPSCEEYAKRVVRMGEAPSTVHNVGGLGDENIRKLKLLTKNELEKNIKFSLNSPFALVTYHPETATQASAEKQFKLLLNALSKTNLKCIFTKSNADAGGTQINKLIDKACQNNDNYISFTSMGVLNYLSAMKYCDVVIGNSSSGVVETPTFGTPCVNIGMRQQGRIITQNVICCDTDEFSILSSIKKALSEKFKEFAKNTQSPYNGGDTASKIANITHDFFTELKYKNTKIFYDADIT